MKVKLENSDTKRQANKLRKKIIDARNRWKTLVRENCIGQRTAKGESKRSPLKILYIVGNGEWLVGIKKEIQSLRKKLAKPENESVSAQRSMWLPTIIEPAKKIRLVAYAAMSPKKISLPQARSYVKKAGGDAALLKQTGKRKPKYVLRYYTGRCYKLFVTYPTGTKEKCTFTEWAVSICPDASSLPKLKRAKNISQLGEFNGAEAICTCRKSALFREEPEAVEDKIGGSDLKSQDDSCNDDAEWR